MDSFSTVQLLYLLKGVGWTLVLSLISFALGSLAGFAVMLARVSVHKPVRVITSAYIQIIQGIPLLVLLFIVYFGVGIFGINVAPLVASAIALMIHVSAFLGEIWRGSVQAIEKTQWEASECLGLSRWQSLILVIIPQALRMSLPPSVGYLVQVIKLTSLASVVGFVELTRAGQIINNSLFQPFLVFVLVGAFYFVLCYPLSLWSRAMERKLNVGNR
ncbi:amino acid ABC transporter membrane protein 2 (PAAT family) [Advenella incenata]|jgi:polar amino acid transport system permease protein|uniref:Amino acid ABC transporter membrane protein 2 (PAAT family) n=1 Tax=Advenella incenata TaxID=267800 RepID=A0A4Q7VRV3_9BURK|nr:amino acid ABC transporter permease [Advenella incenata]RZT99261.1 amino acid ABC transporter membrane protein 2 (PAAT family) [Advenella incenata]